MLHSEYYHTPYIQQEEQHLLIFQKLCTYKYKIDSFELIYSSQTTSLKAYCFVYLKNKLQNEEQQNLK